MGLGKGGEGGGGEDGKKAIEVGHSVQCGGEIEPQNGNSHMNTF